MFYREKSAFDTNLTFENELDSIEKMKFENFAQYFSYSDKPENIFSLL